MTDDIELPACLDRRRNNLPTDFKPEEAKENIRKGDAVIEYAQDIRDWPLLEKAVNGKIEEIRQLLTWWDQSVRAAGNKPIIADSAIIDVAEASKITGVPDYQVSRWRTRIKSPDKFRASLYGPVYRKTFGDGSQPNQQSLSNEHYTPAKYVEAARKVLGAIDLDPASCKEANKTVKAKQYFDTGGLEQEWVGRVWLNPPYGRLAGSFIEKLADEVQAGRVGAAIALVNAHCTDTAWFQRLWSGLLCFTDHRINFYGDESRSGSTHGSAFAYFGPNETAFVNAFRQFGPIVKQVAHDDQKP